MVFRFIPIFIPYLPKKNYLNISYHKIPFRYTVMSGKTDFRAPDEPVLYDSGAGVIIACGLLETAEHVPSLEQQMYRNADLRILQACEERFADWNLDSDGILFGGGMMYHKDKLAGQAYIYNDYLLLEAILRLLGKHFTTFLKKALVYCKTSPL